VTPHVRAGSRRSDGVDLGARSPTNEELPFPPDTAIRLAQLRADTGLTMPDCCVLLAAEHLGAGVASCDDRLVRAARGRELRTFGV
jgi:predicted nucleic acid-binding protein